MGSMFRHAREFAFSGAGHGQFDDERAARHGWIVPQLAVERPHEGARQKQPQPGGLRAVLKGLKKLFCGADARTGVGDAEQNGVIVGRYRDIDPLVRRVVERPLAVLDEIEQHLQQAVTIGPYRRQFFRHLPVHIDSRIAAVRLEDDAQLIQGFEQVDAGYWVGTLAVLELDRGDAGERFDQRSQRLKIPIGAERTGADQVLIDHGDGAADVADLVRNRAHQDARAGQQLLQAGFLAFPQLLGSIHDEGGQARAHGRLVGGKEYTGQNHVAARALAAALHLGAERRLRRAADRPAAERLHIAPDAPTGKFAVGYAEHSLTLVGFAAFLDPPKEGVLAVLQALKQNGISVVVMTGDNQYVTQKIAHDVGLNADRILVGNQLDTMDDAAVAHQAENGAIFARVSPEQKNRVILALKARGHVVGYMGDGINDAPSLHTADVGISVMNGVNVAKDAAKIILLEKDLAVINEGVLEGRRSFANIMKYIIMGTSSNFGNMFSMAAASLFLPFLPMLPSQILLNNFLYDVSQVSIPTDNVDPAMVQKPKRWQIGFIRQFMAIIGPISSIYDFLTFGVLLWVFHASTNESLFHTGWFVESLATQTLVVFVIRTAVNPLKSRPSRPGLSSVLAIVTVATVLPYTPLGKLLRFPPPPVSLLAAIAFLAVTYLFVVQAVKTWFYRRHALL